MTNDVSSVRPLRSPGFACRAEADGHVLEDESGARRYRINGTALAFWQLCDGSTSMVEMLDAMCDLFDAPRSQLERDLAAAAEELARLGLLVQDDR